TYLYDVYMYESGSSLIKETLSKEHAEYSQFRVKNMNKKYPLDLSTDYPIVDEYYKMLDYEVKQKIATLHYVDGVPTFTYEPASNHDELEQQFQEFMESYYYDVTDEKIQELGYPFDKITVDNNISSDLIDIEKECVEKYEHHYNGLRCLTNEVNSLHYVGEDASDDKENTIKYCFEILCKMKNFTKTYSTVIDENPEDIDLINEYIEKYSSAYMYILQNRDTLTSEDMYEYLHNFLFVDEEMMDLRYRMCQIDVPNPDELLTITD
ncbi:MAG: hypothetical protein LUG94_01585, partial [Ruminococcus sp.]|nr:hypothetical protein [Ruminococcus sp.]